MALLKCKSKSFISKLSNNFLFHSDVPTMAHKAKCDLVLLFLISLATVWFAYSSSVHSPPCHSPTVPRTFALAILIVRNTLPLNFCMTCFICFMTGIYYSSLLKCVSLRDILPDHPRELLHSQPLSSDPASSFFRVLTHWIALYIVGFAQLECELLKSRHSALFIVTWSEISTIWMIWRTWQWGRRQCWAQLPGFWLIK